MQIKSNAIWVILLSFFLAYLLAIVPFPLWAMNYRPEWVALVLIYWTMALPYRVGIGSAWCAGLLMDILEGSALGINALGFSLVAYITLSLHKRLRMFTALQQSGVVLALITANLIITHWLQILSGQTVRSNLFFLMAAITSAIIWPTLFQLLRHLRRGFKVA